jgi:CelD/BcsL family acetyltransferase involved in cellulose biosynthesis
VYSQDVGGGERFCGVFSSITDGELARESHGQLLLINPARMCCQPGLAHFDLGIDEARFKRLFCTEIEPLLDTFRPLTARESIAALGYRLAYHLRRNWVGWSADLATRSRSCHRHKSRM